MDEACILNFCRERSHSGLVRGPGKLVTDEVRGFKSHPLRQVSRTVISYQCVGQTLTDNCSLITNYCSLAIRVFTSLRQVLGPVQQDTVNPARVGRQQR